MPGPSAGEVAEKSKKDKAKGGAAKTKTLVEKLKKAQVSAKTAKKELEGEADE